MPSSPLSRLFNIFSNWIVYILSLIVCGGLSYAIYKINSNVALISINGWNSLVEVVLSSPLEFILALIATIALVILAFFIILVTFTKFFKVHIIVPVILIAGNLIGYYYGYGFYVFLVNIAILIVTVLVVTLSVVVSLPN